MKDSIVLNLPYPVTFLGIQFMRKRNIGFLFTNLSMFLFRETMNIETSVDLTKWHKENGDARLQIEMIYCAALAYCMQNKAKQNFTKSLLSVAISACSDIEREQLVRTWQLSQTFGMKADKKKVTARTRS